VLAGQVAADRVALRAVRAFRVVQARRALANLDRASNRF
jgi:hypothetical protein